MRQGSLYFKLVILFNFLLIHSTLTAPLTTSLTVATNDINQNDSTTIASIAASTEDTPTSVSSSSTAAEISHVIKQELDNNKEIYDKTGTLSNKINNINKKNYDNDYDTVNEIKDDEKNNALSNDKRSEGSSMENDKLSEVSSSVSAKDDLLTHTSSLEGKSLLML